MYLNIIVVVKELELLNPTKKFDEDEILSLRELYRICGENNFLFVSYLHSYMNMRFKTIAVSLLDMQKADTSWIEANMPCKYDVFEIFKHEYTY